MCKNNNFNICWFYCVNAKRKVSKTWKNLFIETYWKPNATMLLGFNFSFRLCTTWTVQKICRRKLVLLVKQQGSVSYVQKLLIKTSALLKSEPSQRILEVQIP